MAKTKGADSGSRRGKSGPAAKISGRGDARRGALPPGRARKSAARASPPTAGKSLKELFSRPIVAAPLALLVLAVLAAFIFGGGRAAPPGSPENPLPRKPVPVGHYPQTTVPVLGHLPPEPFAPLPAPPPSPAERTARERMKKVFNKDLQVPDTPRDRAAKLFAWMLPELRFMPRELVRRYRAEPGSEPEEFCRALIRLTRDRQAKNEEVHADRLEKIMWLLGELGGPESADFLAEVLGNHAKYYLEITRVPAALALGELLRRRYVLQEGLPAEARREQEPWARKAAAALELVLEDEAAPMYLRQQTAVALGHAGDHQSAAPLIRMLQQYPEGILARNCHRALCRISGRQLRPDPEVWRACFKLPPETITGRKEL